MGTERGDIGASGGSGNSILDISTSVNQILSLSSQFKLNQNYPNPFNQSTTIRYEVPNKSHIILTIYNINGQLVDKLVNQKQEPGFYSVDWNARNVSTGVYFYQIKADGFSAVKKCILMK